MLTTSSQARVGGERNSDWLTPTVSKSPLHQSKWEGGKKVKGRQKMRKWMKAVNKTGEWWKIIQLGQSAVNWTSKEEELTRKGGKWVPGEDHEETRPRETFHWRVKLKKLSGTSVILVVQNLWRINWSAVETDRRLACMHGGTLDSHWTFTLKKKCQDGEPPFRFVDVTSLRRRTNVEDLLLEGQSTSVQGVIWVGNVRLEFIERATFRAIAQSSAWLSSSQESSFPPFCVCVCGGGTTTQRTLLPALPWGRKNNSPERD